MSTVLFYEWFHNLYFWCLYSFRYSVDSYPFLKTVMGHVKVLVDGYLVDNNATSPILVEKNYKNSVQRSSNCPFLENLELIRYNGQNK